MATNPEHLRPPSLSTRLYLNYYAERADRSKRKIFCVQVGANDGKINDPLHEHIVAGWSGLLIEPQTDVFENELKKTYAGREDVKLANVALAPTRGVKPFFRIAISSARWAHGLSSFERRSLEDHIANGYVERKSAEEGIPYPKDNLDQIIQSVDVPTIPLMDLLEEHRVASVDVLCIDTEGYDYEILRMFNFETYRPDVVLFESKNLDDEDYVRAKVMLAELGYTLYWHRGDTLATLVEYPHYRRYRDRLARRARLIIGRERKLKRTNW